MTHGAQSSNRQSELDENKTGEKEKTLPTEPSHSEIDKLDSQITALVLKRNFAGAAALQLELDQILAAINTKRDLEAGIKEAVAKRDFAKAGELQARLNEMNEGTRHENEVSGQVRKC